MPHFTKQIETSIGVRSFYFNRIYTVNGTKYHVSVRDRVSHYFIMSEENGSWFIPDNGPIPDWITGEEKELEKAIIEHLQNN